jgi:hypothetical protein
VTWACARWTVAGRFCAGLFETVRTAPPIGDFGLVDLVAPIVDRRETRRGADRAIDVDHAAAGSTDQVVVIVADAIFEASRRSRGLNAPDEALGDQQGQGVVDRLQRDGTDPGPDDLGHGVGRDVRLTRDRLQYRQALGRHLDAAFTKKRCRIGPHWTEVA